MTVDEYQKHNDINSNRVILIIKDDGIIDGETISAHLCGIIYNMPINRRTN